MRRPSDFTYGTFFNIMDRAIDANSPACLALVWKWACEDLSAFERGSLITNIRRRACASRQAEVVRAVLNCSDKPFMSVNDAIYEACDPSQNALLRVLCEYYDRHADAGMVDIIPVDFDHALRMLTVNAAISGGIGFERTLIEIEREFAGAEECYLECMQIIRAHGVTQEGIDAAFVDLARSFNPALLSELYAWGVGDRAFNRAFAGLMRDKIDGDRDGYLNLEVWETDCESDSDSEVVTDSASDSPDSDPDSNADSDGSHSAIDDDNDSIQPVDNKWAYYNRKPALALTGILKVATPSARHIETDRAPDNENDDEPVDSSDVIGEADSGAARDAVTANSIRDNLDVTLAWFRRHGRRRAHSQILETHLTLLPLRIPLYVLCDILALAIPAAWTFLTPVERCDLSQRLNESVARLPGRAE